MTRHLIAIDQGTTGTTVVVMNEQMEILAAHNEEYPQHYPKPGWVEHDPEEIWASGEATLAGALAKAGISGEDVAAIGITNQRETTVLWDRETGRPVHNAIVWQCRRTADYCDGLKAAGHVERVRKTTGLVLAAYFSGTKIRWMLENVEGARARAEAGEVAFVSIDTFLTWRLTGGEAHVTDVSNASRTLLMNLKTLDWDPEMCALFEVPQSVLPGIRSSAEVYGRTRGVKGLPDGIPVAGMAGDQQAALFGQACFSPGEGKLTFGTGAFLLVNTGTEIVESTSNMLTTVAWQVGGETHYALEGSAFIAGAAVQWLRDGLGIIDSAPAIEALAESVDDTDGVILVPAFTGLGAPHWRQDARGAILNLTRGNTRAHIARACLEGIAQQNADILQAMEADRGAPVETLKVDGGACRNNLLMQMQADLANVEVVRPVHVETTAMGAIFLAGLGAGVWENTDAIRAVWAEDRRFAPAMDADARTARRGAWSDALARV